MAAKNNNRPNFKSPRQRIGEALCIVECVVLALKERNDPHGSPLKRCHPCYAEVVCLERVIGLLSAAFNELDFVGVKVTGIE